MGTLFRISQSTCRPLKAENRHKIMLLPDTIYAEWNGEGV